MVPEYLKILSFCEVKPFDDLLYDFVFFNNVSSFVQSFIYVKINLVFLKMKIK